MILRIFISSVQKEFAEERAALRDYLAAPRSCGKNFGESFGENFGDRVRGNVQINRRVIAGATRQRPLNPLGGEAEGPVSPSVTRPVTPPVQVHARLR